jgi:hypothetical protein
MSNQYLKINSFYSRVATNTKKYDEYRTNNCVSDLISGGNIYFKEGRFTINPNNRYVVVRFVINNLISNVNLSLDINTSNVNIGDILVIFIKKEAPNNNINCSLSNKFYILRCGDFDDNFNLPSERNSLKFIFDGEKYVSTYDNC